MTDEHAFKEGMRRLASGVTIVTTGAGPTRAGLTATAVCALSTDPPQLLACINKSASAHDWILESKLFCVNVLSTEDMDLAGAFASSSRRCERFQSGPWASGTEGVPVLEDAVASFDCRIARSVDAATHSILIGEVIDVRYDREREMLLYADGGFGIYQPAGSE